jgi:cation diffusion facilitator CzcD-associated flavoprotein CzcO
MSELTKKYDAIVVGAGFSGLYQLHQLRDRLGLSVVVLEAGDGVGGTWYWNRYPGARCDSESYSYSYSFSKELQQEWSWSERYAEHGEIRKYLDHVADRFDLRRDIRLGVRVKSAHYDEAANLWTLTTEAGETLHTQFFITAVGCLSAANIPRIPGLESFAGKWYHTGLWPHEGVDFSGKRVGLVGTGSTGIQAAPVIAEQAGELTVFQRTANYSVPARNGKTSPEVERATKDRYDEIRRIERSTVNGHPFEISSTSALEVSPEERKRRYEDAWAFGSLKFRATFSDLLRDLDANHTASEFIRGKIREIVKEPGTAAALTPMDHPFASKRPPIDTHYFETFNRPNVRLVDLKATPIERITTAGIKTSDAEYPLDILVFATGFDALTGPLLKIDIRGLPGHNLRDDWVAGPRTYLGLQVAGYPNMFTITGPGSPAVLANMPVAIEQHTEWITACIAHMRDKGLQRIETSKEVSDEWVDEVNAAANRTLLPMASSSWYLGANVPGKPRVFLPYAGGMAHYASICADVVKNDYRGFSFS